MEEPRKPDAGGAEPAAPRSPREEEEELSEVGRERKRKREEKRAQKALRAEANKDRKPWLSQAGAAAGQGTADGTAPAAEASGSAYKKHKKRGWMTRLEERNGAGGIENIDFETYFVPAPEDLAVTAPHWQLLKDSLKGLQETAKTLAVKPSWAWQQKDEAGKTECTGPVLASQLKGAMKQTALAQDPDKPFNEQDLKFRSFGIFLDHATEHSICLVKCPVHRGNVWVDLKGNEARLPTLATMQERDASAKAQEASGTHPSVQLVGGKARSRSAKYQVAEGTCPIGSVDRPLKLGSWALWESMKRPKFVCAPMVEQSELPFRLLCRKYGTTLAYTPMFHARLFLEDENYRKEQFTTCAADRPLIVQFCANDADIFAAAASMVEGQCDAVDLNLGCPQGIAKKGHYGSFLMEDMELIYKLVNTAHTNSNVPITAKMRVFEDDDKSLQYAKMLQDAGAQLITVHGRTRDNKGATATPADWNIIRKIKEHVSVPVISNGNIVRYEDVMRCLEETKADAVMSAEWLRRNPALFAGKEAQHQDRLSITLEYLDLCAEYPVALGFMRSHCFKFLLEQLNAHPDMRMSFVEAKTRDELKACTVALQQRIAAPQ